ncbi:hypothetical protein V1507DRAFT_446574 [Lipomyces tetrasporus]
MRLLSRAEYFDVSIPFLLQQAAWLYERELQQVREEMQRVTSQSGLSSVFFLFRCFWRSLSVVGADAV